MSHSVETIAAGGGQAELTAVPGFAFVGLHWQRTLGSGLFHRAGRDADYVVDRLVGPGCAR